MSQRMFAALAAAAVTLISPKARAEMVIGASVIVPEETTSVSFKLIGSNAAFSGELSFLGSGTNIVITNPAESEAAGGGLGLGHDLFANHPGDTGDEVTIEGLFHAGDVLHFAYNVFEPTDSADVFRTDDAATASQFAWDAQTRKLYVEDLRPGHWWYDADYDDIVAQVTFGASTPAPGSLALLGLAGSLALGKRRRGSAR